MTDDPTRVLKDKIREWRESEKWMTHDDGYQSGRKEQLKVCAGELEAAISAVEAEIAEIERGFALECERYRAELATARDAAHAEALRAAAEHLQAAAEAWRQPGHKNDADGCIEWRDSDYGNAELCDQYAEEILALTHERSRLLRELEVMERTALLREAAVAICSYCANKTFQPSIPKFCSDIQCWWHGNTATGAQCQAGAILARIPAADQSALDALIQKRVAEARREAAALALGAVLTQLTSGDYCRHDSRQIVQRALDKLEHATEAQPAPKAR